MPKFPVLSGRETVKILAKIGFRLVDQHGSHVILIKEEGIRKYKVIVPLHPELKRGTLLSIIRQAGLTKEQFTDLI